MTLQEAKDLAQRKKEFIGKPFSTFIVKAIIPLPEEVEMRDLVVYIRAYLATGNIDIAAKVAQVEDHNYGIGIVSDAEFNEKTTPYFGKFEAHFPL